MFQDLTQQDMAVELVAERAVRGARAVFSQLPLLVLVLALAALVAVSPAARPLAAFLVAIFAGCGIAYFVISDR